VFAFVGFLRFYRDRTVVARTAAARVPVTA